MDALPIYLDCGRVYDIISGSNGTARNTPQPVSTIPKGYTDFGKYGLFCPDIGLIVLNFNALYAKSEASSPYGLETIFPHIPPLNMSSSRVAAGAYENPDFICEDFLVNDLNYAPNNSKKVFELCSEETVSSTIFFCRVPNESYNYSSNPSFLTGSGALIHNDMINHPRTYITTVGLYNDNQELLAVAKLSQPLLKDFTKEALIRVKIDW
jgi:hypothetical protein